MSHYDSIIEKASRLHLDECEATFIKKKIITVRITDSEIAEIKQNFDKSLAIRVIDKKKILSARTSKLDKSGQILDEVLNSKPFVQSKPFWKSLPHPSKYCKTEKTYDSNLKNITSLEVTDLVTRMINAASHTKIKQISGSLNIVYEEFEIENTNGIDYTDEATYIAGTINSDLDNSGTPLSGVGAMSSRTLDAFSPEKIGNDSKEMCIGSSNPQTSEGGPQTIIFEPYAIGEMLAFVFAPNFSIKSYFEKRSCFSERFEKEIAVPGFSLMDDPLHPEGIGSKAFDDEGTPTKTRFLIKSGNFSDMYSDSFNAFKNNLQSTGNAARMGSPMGRDAKPIPTPSPHNLRIEEGTSTTDEMIRETKLGLLVGRLWYTYAVNPERGDFSCTARSGVRIIKNGRIVSSGKPVRIIHSLPALLKNISAIGKDSRNVLQWHALPCITPSVKVDKIAVNTIT